MRFSGIVRASLVLAAFMAANARASADVRVLTGKMAWWNQVVGFWTCEVNLDPSPGQMAQKGFTVAEASIAPDNVFHWSERASGLAADQYDGYDDDKKVWWETQSDSTGFASLFISSDGLTYEGVPALGPPFGNDTSRYRETYSIGADGTFDETVTRLLGGTWHPFNEASCKRVTGGTRSTLSDSGGIGPRTTTHHV